MTIATTTSKAGPYSGNGSTTVFSVPFKFLANADLEVYLLAADGTQTKQTITTHYTVSGAGAESGGSVTMVTAPASGQKLTILRVVAETQLTDFRNAGQFFPETHESAFDKVTQLVQQLSERASRAFRVLASSDLASFEFPNTGTAAQRQLKVLGFDSAGNPTLTDSSGGSADILKADLASTASGKGAAFLGRGAPVVSSITALRALLKISAAQHAFVTGYYAQGDGGGGAYWYDSSDTTSADNGGTIIVATDGGRWKLIETKFVSVKQFGAKGDGVTNDLSVLNVIVGLLNTNAIKSVFFPAGSYLINGALTAITATGVVLFGEGPRQSVITQTANADTLWFKSSDPLTQQTSDITLRDLGINQTISAPTAGIALRLSRCTRGYFTNIDIRNIYRGIVIEGGNDLHFDSLTVTGAFSWTSLASGSNLLTITNYAGTIEIPSEIFFSDFNIKGAGPAPLHLATAVTIEVCDGVWFDNGHLGFSYNTPIFINPQANASLSIINIEFSNVYVDGNLNGNPASFAVYIAGSTLPTVKHIKFDGCVIKNFDGGGITADLTTLRDLRVTSSLIADNGTHAISVIGCDEVVIADNTIKNNNVAAGANDAMALNNVTAAIVTGNLVLAGAAAHTVGLSCASSTDIVAGNNIFQGHTTDMSVTASARISFRSNRKHGSDPTVVAADGLPIPIGYDVIEVTGNTNFSNISAPLIPGYVFTLRFTGTPTVFDAAGNIKLTGNFVATPDSTLTLMGTSVGWTEVSRAIV